MTTNEHRFTPGPWHLLITRDNNSLFTHYVWPASDIDSCRIAAVYGEANAHLIAAAPELLEACKNALRTFGYYADAGHDVDEPMDMLEAAIAKAEGK